MKGRVGEALSGKFGLVKCHHVTLVIAKEWSVGLYKVGHVV